MGVRDKLKLQEYSRAVRMQGDDGIRSHPHVSSFDCYGEISCDIIVSESTAYCPTERIRSRRVSSQPVGD